MADDDSPRRFEEGGGVAEQLRDQEEEEGVVSEEDAVVEELEGVVESEEFELGESEVRGELAGQCGADEIGVKLDETGVGRELEVAGGEEGGIGLNWSIERSELEGAKGESDEQVENEGEETPIVPCTHEEDEHELNETEIDHEDKKSECKEEDVKSTAVGSGAESRTECNFDNLHHDVRSVNVVSEEEYHMNDAVEEKEEGSEKNLILEQCEVLTAFDDSEQIDESRKKGVKEEDVEENTAGCSDSIAVEPTDKECSESMGELSVAVPEIVMNEQENALISASRSIFESKQVRDIEDASMEDASAPRDEDRVDHPGREQGDHKVHSKWMSELELESFREVDNVDSAVQFKVEDILFVAEHQEHGAHAKGLDHIEEFDNPENEGGDDDEEMITEAENIGNKEKVKEDHLAAPDINFSLRNIELEPTIGEEEIDEEFIDGEDLSIADAKNETQIDTAEAEKSNAIQKRGRKSAKVVSTKKTEEDVCFICFDGGDLVVCDRRGCPKVYHPSCINRDKSFFQAKGHWNCGWHLCSKCEKNSQYMCFTCTFSLCKGCIKGTVFYSVRGNKGFCETCLTTINCIQSKEQGNSEAQPDFEEKNCWENLFKNYWLDLKGRLQLTSEEIAQAKNRWIGSDAVPSKQESADEAYNVNNNADSGLNNSSGNVIALTPKRKKSKQQSKSVVNGEDCPSGSDSSGNGNKSKTKKIKRQVKSPRKRGSSANESEGGTAVGSNWASSELLKFVMHMRNGNESVLSQFEVQELLLEYIKTNKLRDPRRKSQIICDALLKGLFRKQRVGHFEMLKLLESHFLMREGNQLDDFQGSSVGNEHSALEESGKADASAKPSKDKKRKMNKKGFGRGTQSNTEEYAAIDNHNISLVFLRRSLMEILLEDVEKFHDKVVGAFVRIRITGSTQIQDMYRLVQIVGTTKTPVPYKVGKRTTDINLEIQNLNKKEVVSIDIISNQEFTEDECKRLRQSIKCGLIPRLTVGDFLEKAMDLQAARVNDWLETEMVRLSHLCDRASDMGRRKEDNVAKLQNLKKPEERRRRLAEIPEVHSDPKMNPSYESEEDQEEAEDWKQENFLRPRGSGFSRQGKDTLSPRKGGSDMSRELGRSLSAKGFSNKGEDKSLTRQIIWDSTIHKRDNEHEPSAFQDRQKLPYSSQMSGVNAYSAVASESVSGVDSDNFQATPSSVSSQTTTTVNESEKMWHYKDPSGKVQGIFSIVQLRKWNSTGYFPTNLTIWRTGKDEDDGVLLLDALAGKFQKETKLKDNQSNTSRNVQIGQSSLPHSVRSATNGSMVKGPSPSQISMLDRASLSVDILMSNAGARNSGYDTRNESTNLPSPTPNQISEGSTEGRAFVNRYVADNTQMDRLPLISSAGNSYRATYNQQISSTGYHLQQPDRSAASVNAMDESRNSVAAAPSMMQPVITPQHSSHNALNNQIPYSQWGNSNSAAIGAENPVGSFQNQVFSGMTSWRPLPTFPGIHPNMGWGVAPPNSNVSWTPTGQVPLPPVVNPGWGVQGTVTPGWVPSGNGTPGYMAPGNSQAAGIMNLGWTGPWGNDLNVVAESKDRISNENSSRPWNNHVVGGDRGGGTRICEYYMSGRCNRGSSCNWLHPQ